jgi:hypothetical protein
VQQLAVQADRRLFAGDASLSVTLALNMFRRAATLKAFEQQRISGNRPRLCRRALSSLHLCALGRVPSAAQPHGQLAHSAPEAPDEGPDPLKNRFGINRSERILGSSEKADRSAQADPKNPEKCKMKNENKMKILAKKR